MQLYEKRTRNKRTNKLKCSRRWIGKYYIEYDIEYKFQVECFAASATVWTFTLEGEMPSHFYFIFLRKWKAWPHAGGASCDHELKFPHPHLLNTDSVSRLGFKNWGRSLYAENLHIHLRHLGLFGAPFWSDVRGKYPLSHIIANDRDS